MWKEYWTAVQLCSPPPVCSLKSLDFRFFTFITGVYNEYLLWYNSIDKLEKDGIRVEKNKVD